MTQQVPPSWTLARKPKKNNAPSLIIATCCMTYQKNKNVLDLLITRYGGARWVGVENGGRLDGVG